MEPTHPFILFFPAVRTRFLLLPLLLFLLLSPPAGADADGFPEAGSLCAAKCGTCPVVCAAAPPPPPPPPKKSGPSPPAATPPPAGGQRGISTPYYYFYTASGAPPSPAAAEWLLPLLFFALVLAYVSSGLY